MIQSVVINVNFTKSSINNSLVILAVMAAISLVRTFFQIAAEDSILEISDKKMLVISVEEKKFSSCPVPTSR